MKINSEWLKLEKENKGINLIYTIYIFLVVARCLRNCFENKKDYFYKLSFKIQFILRFQEYYDAISNHFIDIFFLDWNSLIIFFPNYLL